MARAGLEENGLVGWDLGIRAGVLMGSGRGTAEEGEIGARAGMHGRFLEAD
jgi:hypothetical protein